MGTPLCCHLQLGVTGVLDTFAGLYSLPSAAVPPTTCQLPAAFVGQDHGMPSVKLKVILYTSRCGLEVRCNTADEPPFRSGLLLYAHRPAIRSTSA